MTMAMEMIDSGLHHAKSTGTLSAGAANGQIAAPGANVLLKLTLPFSPKVWNYPGAANQTYVHFRSLDGNVSNVVLDATQFETDVTTGQPVLRLRVDALALPATVECAVEVHHSIGR